MLSRIVVIVPALFLGSCVSCIAKIDSAPSVTDLSHKSDTVLVGTAVPRTSESPVNGAADVRVLRVLKGSSLLAGTLLHLQGSPATGNCDRPSPNASITAVWFLDTAGDGTLTYAASPRSQSCNPFRNDYEVPAVRPAGDWGYADGDAPEVKLAYELTASFVANQGRAPLVFLKFPAVFEGMSPKIESAIYVKMASSAYSAVQLTGKLGLIRAGDASSLMEISEATRGLLNTRLQSEAVIGGSKVQLSYQTKNSDTQTYAPFIAQSVREVVKTDDSTVTALGLMLTSDTVPTDVKHAAARALRNIHTAKAVRYLAPLLSGSDPTLRVEAIGGLSCFANSLPTLDYTQADGGFDLNRSGRYKTPETMQHFAMGEQTILPREAFYLDYWETWWNNHAASI